jgi:hypothetical protein
MLDSTTHQYRTIGHNYPIRPVKYMYDRFVCIKTMEKMYVHHCQAQESYHCFNDLCLIQSGISDLSSTALWKINKIDYIFKYNLFIGFRQRLDSP